MAEITVTNRNEAYGQGNKDIVVANCASLADGDTWNTKLGSVENLFLSGQSNLQDFTWSAVGGIITFAVTAGPLLNVSLMAIGLP